MKPMIVVVLVIAAALALLASSATAMHWNGTQPGVGGSGYQTPGTAAARAEIARYVAEVRPLYAMLLDCSSSCNKLDFPPHRCAACDHRAADLAKIAANAKRVEVKLASLDVPAALVSSHGDLIQAAFTLHTSSAYIASTLKTSPGSLLAARFASPARGRGGVTIIRRLSPGIAQEARLAALIPPNMLVATFSGPQRGRGGVSIVSRRVPGATPQARLAALDRMGPVGASHAAFMRARFAALSDAQHPAPSGSTPGEQAMALLTQWRDRVQARAQAAGVSLPAAFYG